jgi:1-deoxy-D-xylulose-5-phosphate reductoisomerase
MKKNICLLGSTGSIGRQTLDVVSNFPDKFKIIALGAHKSVDILAAQAKQFNPELVVLTDWEAAEQLKVLLRGYAIRVLAGEEGLLEAATYPGTSLLVNALVGFAGLKPTLAAIAKGIDIALANKETLVVAGNIITHEAAKNRVRIIPIDSEHSAVFQCLQGSRHQDVERIILTASGGPFREYEMERLAQVTLQEALRHPNWEMGAKITIDSATLVNKGLEVLEAHWLFSVPFSDITVVIHPQSIIHSLVEFKDGSILAQLGFPDMRIPIIYALSYPERWPNSMRKLNLVGKELTFFAPDTKKFPCLTYAYTAGKAGGIMPAVLNAANEVAVEAFLQQRIPFLAIQDTIKTVMDQCVNVFNPNLSDIMAADAWARKEARAVIDASIGKGLLRFVTTAP